MQSTPGVGRGVTVDFSEHVPSPTSRHASSQSAVSPPSQKLKPGPASSDMSRLRVAANLGPGFTHSEHPSFRPDSMEPPGSLHQHAQHQQVLHQEYQRQFQPNKPAKQPSANQFEPPGTQGHLPLHAANEKKQWFVNFDQQQQQMIEQQQLHSPTATTAATPRQQTMQQQLHAPAPAPVPPQQHFQRVQILKRSPQPSQQIQLPYQQQQPSPQQMVQQQPKQQPSPCQPLPPQPSQPLQRQQRASSGQPSQQQMFSPTFVPPVFSPPSISPPLIDPFTLQPIDTSKPPPPIGVPLPGPPRHVPPLGPPTTPFSHANPVKLHAERQLSPPQEPLRDLIQMPLSFQPRPKYRVRPEKSKPSPRLGGDGSAFAALPDEVWDSIPLGGGYNPCEDMGVQGPSATFPPAAGDPSLLPQPTGRGSPGQTWQDQSKGFPKQKRDGTEGQKPWARKDKAKGRGITRKDGQGMVGTPPPNKPAGAYGPSNPTRQPPEVVTLALSQEQTKNEYEWQSFKIIRKVRKVLGNLKDEQDAGKAAAEIAEIMKAESGRLACFPWPKEQFVALDEILGWGTERPEAVEAVCKLIQELHGHHPKNFREDLTNTLMKRHMQYIKVSTATNKEKLYASYSSVVGNLFVLSRSANHSFREILDGVLDLIVAKWITCSVQDSEEDPVMLTGVYTFCLRALFIVTGPHLGNQIDERYNTLLRDQVLGNQPRYVKEAMLDLLLLRAVGWKGLPEFKTESSSDSKIGRETGDDADDGPVPEERHSAVEGEKVQEDITHLGGKEISEDMAQTKLGITGGGDASSVGQSRPAVNGGDSMTVTEWTSPSRIGSTAKFQLPTREITERGAIMLDQAPVHAPHIPALPISDGLAATHQTTWQQSGLGAPISTRDSWSPVYLNRPQETMAFSSRGSAANHALMSKPKLRGCGQPAHADIPQGAEQNSPPVAHPYQASLELSSRQPTDGSPTSNSAVPAMPSSGFGPETTIPSDTCPSAQAGAAMELSSTCSPRPTPEDQAMPSTNSNPSTSSASSSTDKQPLSVPTTSTAELTTATSSQVSVTSLCASEQHAEQFRLPDTQQQTDGSASSQLSANNSNNNRSEASAGIRDQQNGEHDDGSRLLSGEEQTSTDGTDFPTGTESGAVHNATEEYGHPERASAGYREPPCHHENFWDEESDSTSDLEQQPPAAWSLGNSRPSEVLLETQGAGESRLGRQSVPSNLDATKDPSQGALHRQAGKGLSSLLHSAAGPQRISPIAFGRGVMRLEPCSRTSGRGSPATGFMTSPLAFIEPTTAPQSLAARKGTGSKGREGTIEQSENETDTKQVLHAGLLQENTVSSTVSLVSNSGPGGSAGKIETQNLGQSQENGVDDDPKAPPDLPVGETTPSEAICVDSVSRPKMSNFQKVLQPAVDITADYFEETNTQDGQRIQDIFRKTGFKVPESERAEQAVVVEGNQAAESNVEPADGIPDTKSQGVSNQGATTRDLLQDVTSPSLGEEPLSGLPCQSTESGEQLIMLCPLCGSDKHRTRQCAVFKKYAPRASTSDGQSDPEEETPSVQKPKRESQFGKTFFCSKCGKEGHLTYDCPVKGHFNIFNQFP
ncbi:uncharacterized protein LOC110985090 [Acanthaster planci]|uniref:Uncharacterized protein LOC110985090 n=1 Tax=Acanthaster planci TaxID=133434 RepID=A0A8B7Z9A3_ACAPL|nr:uncharacterized protein LOC110985090 [Acanthaster planci]